MMKHVVNGDQQNGWYCYQCNFTTRNVAEAAEHDGTSGIDPNPRPKGAGMIETPLPTDHPSPKRDAFASWTDWTLALAKWVIEREDADDMSPRRLACVFDVVEFEAKREFCPNPSPAPEVMGTPRNDPKLVDILRRYDESDDPGSMLILAAYEAGKLAQPDPWVDVKVGWVSTAERLPEQGKLVLVHHGDHDDFPSIAWLVNDPVESGKEWLSTETAPQDEPIYFSLENVTHWRELPAPPETRATEGK